VTEQEREQALRNGLAQPAAETASQTAISPQLHDCSFNCNIGGKVVYSDYISIRQGHCDLQREIHPRMTVPRIENSPWHMTCRFFGGISLKKKEVEAMKVRCSEMQRRKTHLHGTCLVGVDLRGYRLWTSEVRMYRLGTFKEETGS
jgi:hypothetical protein